MTDLAEQHLVDEFGNDLGVIEETELVDCTDPGYRQYTVWVRRGKPAWTKRSEDGPRD